MFVYFVSKGQITLQLTSVICRVVNERNTFLLFTPKLNNSENYWSSEFELLVATPEKAILCIINKVSFIHNL
jgi:hypothetical protein